GADRLTTPALTLAFWAGVVTLIGRSCVARQEPYIPGALSILPGTVPGRVRGLGYMVPTYFRRELRDRVLQRPSRLRTFVFWLTNYCRRFCPHNRHTPRKRSIQYAAASRSITTAADYWITRRSLSSGSPKARPGGG